ncbi:MAG: PAS domain-containing protein, partial [Rhodosalinus sp.]
MENAGNVALDLAGPLSPSSDALLEAAQVGTWEVDIAGRCVRVSGAFLALLGRRPRAAVFRREWTRLLHPDDVPTALSARKDLIRGTSDRLSIDLRVRHSTRGFVWITAHGSVTALAPDGTPSRLGGIALALAETTSLGKRLEKQAAALRETTDGTAITDASGCYTFMNPMHRQMFGIPETADISMIHWSELYEPEVAARIVGTVMPDLQSAGSWRGELRGRRLDDGRPVPQEVSLTLGSDGGIICATRDIAERLRDQRDRLRLREEMIATQRQEVVHLLTAGVAHDLMN